MEVNTGDMIEIGSNKVGQPPRRGTVERVLQPEPLKLEVTWDDGHRSIVEPAGGVLQVVDRPAS
ncbi:MAG TPA: DUF1918 domain-containing protein [Nitriliruptorales bacterium]|nr:DUF1918 domain-containing protein [Nitriliruptorales bacterium]